MDVNDLRESPLVHGATEARRPTRWWLVPVLIFAVAVIGVGALVDAAYARLVPSLPGSIGAQWLEFFTNAGSLLALWLWLHFKERRSFASVGFRGTGAAAKFGIGLALGAGMMALTMAVLVASGQYREVVTPDRMVSGTAVLLPVLLLVLMWAVQGSTEEALMRGYLLQTSALQLPGWLAVLLPGLIFSGVHFATEGILPVAGVNIVLFALMASFLALRQGSLWMACGIHTGWNWCQANVFNVPVSGNAYDTGVFHFRPVESASSWIGGGSFGPENSPVVTFIWGLAAIAAYRYFRTRSGS